MPPALNDLFQTDLDPLLILGHDHRITLANEGMHSILGHPPVDLLGELFVDLVHPADREWVLSALQKVARHIPRISFDGRLHHADGGLRWMHWVFRRSPEGTLYASGRDETVRRQVERTVRRREQRRKAMVDHAADPLVVLDASGQIIDVNAAMAGLFDRSTASLMGIHIAELIPSFADRRPHHGIPFEARVDATTGPVDLEIRTNAFTFEDETMVVALARDVGRRKAHTEALATLSIRATLENEAKSGFVADMSHAMRTPLSAILGYTEMLLEAEHPPDDLERIRSSATWLLDLVDDVLDLARIESGARTLDPTAVPIDALLDDLRIAVEPLRRGTLTLTSTASPPTLTTDAGRIRQVLTTLLTHGIRRADGQAVELHVSDVEDAGRRLVAFTVTDAGPLLEAADLEEAFEPFATGGRGHDQAVGLGLSIARRLVESLGGRLSATSDARGNVFTARLPR